MVAGGADDNQVAELAARVAELALSADLLVELKAAAAEAAVPDVTAAPDEVQVFREGQWLEYPREGGLTLTRAHFDQCVANHKRFATDPMVDREHESTYSTAPAMGWVKALRVTPDGNGKAALFARVEWTDIGRAAVEAKHFRYISGGVYLNAKDRATSAPVGARLDHIAICCKPFIDGMQPITANARGGAPTPAPPLQLDAATLAILGLDGTATTAQVTERISALTKQTEQAKARTAKMEDDKLVAEVDAAVGAMLMTPAERNPQLALARANPALWRASIEMRIPIRPGGAPVVLANLPRRLNGVVLTNAAGQQVQLPQHPQRDAAIAAYRKEHPEASYGDAVVACARDNPALFGADE